MPCDGCSSHELPSTLRDAPTVRPTSAYIGDSVQTFAVPKGSMSVGDRASLPAGAEEPITVYVNGVEQRRDIDFRVEEGAIVFPRPILKESNLGFSRWAALYLGLFGTYRAHESVDIHFGRNGRVEVADDVTIDGAS